jgi:SAM-dependent methyltransferase
MPSIPDVWEEYALFFHTEEGTVFPHDHPEMEFYRRIRSEYPGDCLEIGAGSGRLAESLFSRGLTVALEPSSNMLSLWSPDASFLAERVRGMGQAMPFRDESFGFACFPYNGLQCVLDRGCRRSILSEAYRILAFGGVFLFEVSPSFERRPEEPRTIRYRAPLPDRRFLTLSERVFRSSEGNAVVYDMIYTTEGFGSAEKRRVVLEMSTFPVMEAVEDGTDQGFSIVNLWGDYDLSSFDPQLSPRLLVLAKKE